MPIRPIRSLLVANRGEIAIRVFRACSELGIRTLGIYSQEDKTALHRYKADETYLVGLEKAPLQAYLDIEAILAVAVERGADAIHPGYGFLSENAEFARACQAAGVLFVGPTPELLEQMGDKLAARQIAQGLGIPVIPGTPEPLLDAEAAVTAAATIGYPVILKAAFGGGGRGMRVARDAADLREQFTAATTEAAAAFGRGDVFLEKFLIGPRHLEVQILADAHGSVVHLFERDCTVQRRHQKVIEIAPAPFLPPAVRERLCQTAVKLAQAVGYVNAGTIEFLLDPDQNFYFIEMNPRVQVEHTVTEMVTGVDIVKSQIRVAEGHALSDPEIGLPGQDAVQMRGYAIQCRITTEDPGNNFTPDYGRITHYRSPAGFGIRLDGGTAFTGAIITPFYDSLLVKVTAWSLNFEETCGRLQRALSEFRVHGVKTNIPFLQNVVRHPFFREGRCTTTFIEETPELFRFAHRRDRASRLLDFIGEITVNGNPTVAGSGVQVFRRSGVQEVRPEHLNTRTPEHPNTRSPAAPSGPPPPGTRQKFQEMGPDRFCAWVREQERLLVTDTTFRDAHQSLLATRVRTFDMLRVAPAIAHQLPGLFSLEMWGGATFDVAMRFLYEDPWERLALLREQIPNILFQMLLRGANAVGYSNYPTNVVRRFVEVAAEAGIDLFRIFDSLNWVPAMAPAIAAAREAGALAEAAICYTSDLFDPSRPRYHLDYYVKLAKELEGLGANLLAIKDMAGLCRPFAARRLIETLRQEVGIPIHFHTHDTAGGQIAALLFAAEAGVDIVDAAISSMAGLTSQPSLETLVAALQRQPRDTGLDLDVLMPHADYWRAVREEYAPFETDLRAPAPDVYLHEIPGGQYSNLRPQAEAMGVGDRLPELKRMYAVVNEMLGDIVKVTPSSKIVGDLAIYMLTHNLTPQDLLERGEHLQFPESVVGFFAGEIGVPPGGFPEALQRVILKDRPALAAPAGEVLAPVDFEAVSAQVQDLLQRGEDGPAPSPVIAARDVMSYLMYPRVFGDFAQVQRLYSDVSPVPTDVFFNGLQPGEETEIQIEEGKTLFVKLVAVTEPDEHGYRTLFFELNGSPREIRVRDKTATATVTRRLQADPDNLHHLGAPMPGAVQEVMVKPGDAVEKGDRLLTLEAMKVLMYVNSPLTATVKEVLVAARDHVEGGDLLVVFE